MKPLYFAYGSNLLPSRFKKRIGRSSSHLCKAVLEDYCFVYDKPSKDGSSKANVRYNKGSEVKGVLFEVTHSEMTSLAGYEIGYDLVKIKVKGNDGKIYECETFIYAGEPSKEAPNKDYQEMISEGYKYFGLN